MVCRSPSLHPHLSTKNGSFQSHYRRKQCSKRLKLEMNFSKVVQQHYVGEVGKPITFVLYIIPIYSVPNNVEIGQHM